MAARLALLGILFVAGWAVPGAGADTTTSGTLKLVSVGTFAAPTYVTSPPGEPDTLFVVEQGNDMDPVAPSRIQVSRQGQVSTFLDLSADVRRTHFEQGLHSIAFAPDYAQSGLVYAMYTAEPDGRVRIEELRRSDSDPYVADPGHRRVLLEQAKIPNGNPAHNGGQLQFGPDGLLWASIGDGRERPNAQDLSNLLGKLIRIDPRPSGGAQYSIPSDNPLLGTPGARGEIWMYGLRNPWRFSFDAGIGDLAIGDVGEETREEVDFFAEDRGRGRNLGWGHWEGTFEFDPGQPLLGPGEYAPPVLEYGSSSGPCAVTGGYVSRDRSVPELLGRYIYGDFCQGVVRSAVLNPVSASGDGPLGDAGSPLQVSHLNSFGQDGLCRLYVASWDGPVYRLESTQPGADSGCQILPPRVPPGPGAPGGAVAAGPSAGPADATAPTLARLNMLRTAFAPAGTGTALVARRRVPRGTAFRYTLSERSDATIRIYRALPGRRSRGRCLARARRGSRCARYLLRGSLVRRGVAAGRRSTPFSGRLGRRALAPGRYRATVRARDGAGNLSAGRAISFRVLRP